MNNAVTIGVRVQRLRLAAGLNQADLAKRVRVPQTTISMIEHGRHDTDADTLDALAGVLGCSAGYLTTRPGPEPTSTRPWLRAYADASKKAVDRQVADTVSAVDALELMGLRWLPDTLPVFPDDVADEAAIEEFAGVVREVAGLAEGAVVGNVIRSVEQLGCLVLPMDDELGRHLGLSMRVNGRPVIRVSRPRYDDEGRLAPPGDRQRFTVAHELGHLTLHSSMPPPGTADDATRIERQAHRFAGAFLTPAEPLLEDLATLGDRVTLTTLQELKRRWGVAIKMLVLRLQQLERIDQEHARSLYKQISARKWNKAEPVPVGHESAVWLQQALGIATKSMPLPPVQNASTHSGLDTAYFERWLQWEPDREVQMADVVELRARG